MNRDVNQQKNIIKKNIDDIKASQKELEELSKKINNINTISNQTKQDIKKSADSLREITKPLENIKDVFEYVVGYILTPVAEELEQSSIKTLNNLNKINTEINTQGKKAAWHNFIGITMGGILSIISLPLINKYGPEPWKEWINNSENKKVVLKNTNTEINITTKELFSLLNGYNLDFNSKIHKISSNFLEAIKNKNKKDTYLFTLKQLKNLEFKLSQKKEKATYEILYCNIELFKAYNITHDFTQIDKIFNNINFSKYNKDTQSIFKWIETEILINKKKFDKEKIIEKYSYLLEKQIEVIDFETNNKIKLNKIVQKRLNNIYTVLFNQEYRSISSIIDHIIANEKISKQIRYQFLWIKASFLEKRKPYVALNIYNELKDKPNDIQVLSSNNRIINISKISKVKKIELENNYIPKKLKKIVLLHSNKTYYPNKAIATPAKKILIKSGYNPSNIITENLNNYPSSTIYVYYKSKLDKKISKNIINIIYPKNSINIDYTKISNGVACKGVRKYTDNNDIIIRLPKPPK